MNYDHAFHAGNFADVVKHAVLTRILIHLALKPAPFRVIDTHAGAGSYDLAGSDAARTGEWRDGVGRLAAMDPASAAGVLLAPYRALLESHNPQGLRHYPGSPAIAQAFLREGDRGLFCETQGPVRDRLIATLGRDRRVKVLSLDGWTALGAFVPPPERRGLVLVDPPFESLHEFERLAASFSVAYRKWPTGTYMLWYPVKTLAARDRLFAALRERSTGAVLQLEFGVAPVVPGGRLAQAGLAIVNAPHTLADQMRTVLPALGQAFSRDGATRWCVDLR